jgi:hypothetical protein
MTGEGVAIGVAVFVALAGLFWAWARMEAADTRRIVAETRAREEARRAAVQQDADTFALLIGPHLRVLPGGREPAVSAPLREADDSERGDNAS